MSPGTRFLSLLQLDRKDIFQIFFYAVFAGLISLSLPLGIQAIINFIQSGRVSASWIVLVFVVVTGVAVVGIMSLMQLRISENIQQKTFIRSSFEFAYRLPKIRFAELYQSIYPPELANRFFDTMSIQKGVAKLLLDFSAALLQIVFGIVLLSLYHPFFILFGVILILLLYLIFRSSYARGLDTSLNESKYKYQVADWLQEIARNNSSFRTTANFNYALTKNNMLVERYLSFREHHFAIIQRQFKQLVGFKIVITVGLLLIGGYLVINQQMNIGQFVAAEIIILLVINSVEKIILGLETFYDVLTSVEKIGQVADMDLEESSENTSTEASAQFTLQTEELRFKFSEDKKNVLRGISLTIGQQERIVLQGENGSGKTTLIRVLSGLLQPTSGAFYVNDDTYRKIDMFRYRSNIGHIIQGETTFEGTILENITYNNPDISLNQVKWALESVKLSDYIKTLPDGLETQLSPEGKQLSSSNAQKILLARSIVHKPALLFYEDPTDKMDPEAAAEIIDFLLDSNMPWSVIVSSRNPRWLQRSTRVITMANGKIITDIRNTPC